MEALWHRLGKKCMFYNLKVSVCVRLFLDNPHNLSPYFKHAKIKKEFEDLSSFCIIAM